MEALLLEQQARALPFGSFRRRSVDTDNLRILQTMLASAQGADLSKQCFLLGMGFACGLSMCMSAVAQGKAGAAGSDALGETGKGFTNYIMVVGLCETIALFSMVFGMIVC